MRGRYDRERACACFENELNCVLEKIVLGIKTPGRRKDEYPPIGNSAPAFSGGLSEATIALFVGLYRLGGGEFAN